MAIDGGWQANDDDKNKFMLYDATREVSTILSVTGIAIDGGKDSLSIGYKTQKCCGGLKSICYHFGYCNVKDVTKTATPYFKEVSNTILYIDLSFGNNRLGGSAFSQVLKHNEFEMPKFTNYPRFDIFKKYNY